MRSESLVAPYIGRTAAEIRAELLTTHPGDLDAANRLNHVLRLLRSLLGARDTERLASACDWGWAPLLDRALRVLALMVRGWEAERCSLNAVDAEQRAPEVDALLTLCVVAAELLLGYLAALEAAGGTPPAAERRLSLVLQDGFLLARWDSDEARDLFIRSTTGEIATELRRFIKSRCGTKAR